MEFEEYQLMIRQMLTDVNIIIHHQQIRAAIESQLNTNQTHPFEQDLIYSDHYGQFPSQPVVHIIQGVQIQTRVLHQAGKGLRDISGGDLLYDLNGEKYAIIQYKSADQNRVALDRSQLQQLLGNCPDRCHYKTRPPSIIPMRMNGFCGCYFRASSGNDTKYLHACEIPAIAGKRGSVGFDELSSGVGKQTFDELFASCRLGAITKVQDSVHYVDAALESNHFVLDVVQKGKWRRLT